MKFNVSAAPSWLLTRASVRGYSHAHSGAPNQDWVETCTSPDGTLFSVVVSDGAGSAPRSHEGARLACEHMAPRLLEIGLELRGRSLSRSKLEFSLREQLQQLRERIAALGGALSDFHCTLAMAVLGDSGGFVCQVGDSIALSSRFRAVRDGELDFFPESDTRVFMPERGEYANETHFITEKDWTEHLRVSPLEPGLDSLFVMTDGAMDLAMVRGRVFRGFLSNLVGQLLTMPKPEERDRLLAEWLDDPRTRKATGDDKTMFIAMPLASTRYAGHKFVINTDRDPPIPAPRTPGRSMTYVPVRAPVLPRRPPDPAEIFRRIASALVLVLVFAWALAAIGNWNSPRLEFEDGEDEVEFSAWEGKTITLRLVAGEMAVIESIRIEPEDEIESRNTGRRCRPQLSLTTESPRCQLYLRAKKSGREAEADVEVVYRNLGRGMARSAEIEVRAVRKER
jgi:hypothetical protein